MNRSIGAPSEKTVVASVIIPTFGRLDYLRDALSSAVRQNFPSDRYEVIVVDNNPDEARALVEEGAKTAKVAVRYVREPKMGVLHARHTGARAARGEILAYVDNDVVTPPGWLDALLAPFSDGKVACVGGKVLPKWEADPPEWISLFEGGYLSLLDRGDETLELTWPQEVYGCNMAMRRRLLYEVGGFNPDIMADRRLLWWGGDGEIGLQRKFYQAGWKVVYEPRAWVHHQIPVSRLSEEYFHRRSRVVGVEISYRAIRYGRSSKRALLLDTARSLAIASYFLLKSFQATDGRVPLRAKAFVHFARAQHALRATLSPTLLNNILKPRYLPTEDSPLMQDNALSG